MFYLKTKDRRNKELVVDIYDDEIFTKCVECGKEIQADSELLINVLENGEFASTYIMCEKCTKDKIKSSPSLVLADRR
ncbi:hypothetical protein [Brevibacillus laterosporus]|uniref:hypothetical protein n=1 Tax=Brevibacillus laterosporus TaxID=1465 RepID=UPI000E6C88D4|nr:hypothetical protein [Brevibacillus laterosporus]AYB38522.1 hypothetical protein D5F52_09765 [Brevibacillus laterosporus]MBM7111467.1 hypothetical protein [Brevibacillus laterosporus]